MAKKPTNRRDKTLSIKLSPSYARSIMETCFDLGFKSISEYLVHLHDHSKLRPVLEKKPDLPAQRPSIDLVSSTDYGHIYCGDSRSLLHSPQYLKPESVDLIMTSPPFGLVRKKDYGN